MPAAGVSVCRVGPLRRAPRLLPQVLQGQPLWVASRWSAELAAVVRRVVDSWSPDIVQAESGVMGACLRPQGERERSSPSMTSRRLRPPSAHWVRSVSSGLFHATEAALWRT